MLGYSQQAGSTHPTGTQSCAFLCSTSILKIISATQHILHNIFNIYLPYIHTFVKSIHVFYIFYTLYFKFFTGISPKSLSRFGILGPLTKRLYIPLANILPVADLRGARGTCPPGGQNSFNFMQFWGQFGKIVCWRPPGELAPPPRGNPGSATVYTWNRIELYNRC